MNQHRLDKNSAIVNHVSNFFRYPPTETDQAFYDEVNKLENYSVYDWRSLTLPFDARSERFFGMFAFPVGDDVIVEYKLRNGELEVVYVGMSKSRLSSDLRAMSVEAFETE